MITIKNPTHTHTHTDLLCACTSVNEKVSTMDIVIGHNELVCHTVHRHEPPVSAQPLTIIHNDDHFVALDKPASIPVSQLFRILHHLFVMTLPSSLTFLFSSFSLLYLLPSLPYLDPLSPFLLPHLLFSLHRFHPIRT